MASIMRANTSRPASQAMYRMAPPIRRPMSGSAHGSPQKTPRIPTKAPTEVSASARECWPSATNAAGLDESKFRVKPAFQAGLFASYHVYLYQPEFMVLDSTYANGRDSQGVN